MATDLSLAGTQKKLTLSARILGVVSSASITVNYIHPCVKTTIVGKAIEPVTVYAWQFTSSTALISVPFEAFTTKAKVQNGIDCIFTYQMDV